MEIYVAVVKSIIGSNEMYKVLEYACEHGHTEVVKYLISNENENYNRTNGLYKACKNGHIEVVKLLILTPTYELVFGLDLFGVVYCNGLCLACECEQLKIVEFMLSKLNITEIIVNIVNNTTINLALNRCLEYVCKNGNIAIIELLISKANEYGIKLNWQVGLEEACLGGIINSVEFVMSKSDDLDLNKCLGLDKKIDRLLVIKGAFNVYKILEIFDTDIIMLSDIINNDTMCYVLKML